MEKMILICLNWQMKAVQNAHEDLKRIATSVISSNDEDGVAKWLDKNHVMQII